MFYSVKQARTNVGKFMDSETMLRMKSFDYAAFVKQFVADKSFKSCL